MVTFEGKSIEEVTKAFYRAVKDYLVTCRNLNKTSEKSSKETFYLLKNPANAKRLLEGLEEYEKGLVTKKLN